MGSLMAKLDQAEIKALISNEIAAAERWITSDLSGDREKAINYYNGVISDVESFKGRSQYVSCDVSNVIGWILPGIIKTFTASKRMVDCLPETPEDEETCEQAADYINYTFWRDNNGYQLLWDATFDALLCKDGIVKQYWDTQEKCTYSTHTGMSDEQLAILMDEDGVEIVAQSDPYYLDLPIEPPEDQMQGMPPEGMDPNAMGPDGQPMQPDMSQQPPMAQPDDIDGLPPLQEYEQTNTAFMTQVALYDVKIKRVTSNGRLKYEIIPPENFIIDRNAINIEDARFVAHKITDVTRSDLIEMGFKRKVVDALPAFAMHDTSPEFLARRNDVAGTYEQTDTAMERVDLYECYIRADINDDGVAETVKVFFAGDAGGGEILDWEEYDDETPFDKIPCNPVPHRFASDSVADEVMDLQKFKTVIGRQMFDNLYLTNLPQPIVDTGSVLNMDALTNPGLGVPIIKKVGSQPIQWNVTPFVADKALQAMEYLDSVIEMRTGVSRSSMALDPETLQNQTATANQNAMDASYSQVELIARNMAELGWQKVFQKSLKIMVKNQDRSRAIRLGNDWVDMDPRYWNVGMDVVINVGLGTGSRDRDMAMLSNILQSQMMITDRFAQSGFVDKAIDMIPKIIETQIRISEAAGIKSPEESYPDIDEQELEAMKAQAAQQAQQGDPKVAADQAKMQADMQMQQQKAQSDMQMAQAKMQMDGQLKQQDIQMQGQNFQMELAMRKEQIAAEMQLKREQLVAEMALKREQIQAEMALKRESGFVDAFHKTQTNLSSGVHIGGEPG